MATVASLKTYVLLLLPHFLHFLLSEGNHTQKRMKSAVYPEGLNWKVSDRRQNLP